MNNPHADTIDFDRIRSLTSLRETVERYAGPLRNGRVRCPVHQGDGANFGIEPDGKHAHCFTCNWRGDVVDLVAAMEGVTVAEAARRLDPAAGARTGGKTKPRTERRVEPPRPEPWQDDAWQADARLIVAEASDRLWSKEGRGALDWLRRRGLVDATISRFKLGFNPTGFRTDPMEILGPGRDGRPQGFYCGRGVTIPWLAPGSWHDSPTWCAVNVRRLLDDFADPPKESGPKCMAITGSRRGYLYPYPDVEPSQEAMPALILEGEFDALIGWQEAGWLAHAVTVGGASQSPRPAALEALARLPLWLIATDADEAGGRAALEWLDRDPAKARRSLPPDGRKDLNDFHRAGGDVRAWVQAEIDRNSPRNAP